MTAPIRLGYHANGARLIGVSLTRFTNAASLISCAAPPGLNSGSDRACLGRSHDAAELETAVAHQRGSYLELPGLDGREPECLSLRLSGRSSPPTDGVPMIVNGAHPPLQRVRADVRFRYPLRTPLLG
jgi:hypothetical protein